MSYRKLLSLFITMLLVVSTCAGCGSSGMAYDSYDVAYPEAPMEMAPSADYVANGSMVKGEYTESSATQQYLESQKLIYSCNIEIETLNFAETVNSIKSAISEFDGFVESDYVSDDSWNWYYSDYKKNGGTLSEYIVVRIPTDNYEAFLAKLDGSGKVMSKQERVTNITKSYNDTSTTIEVLEKEEDMLLEMMDQCNTIDEMMTVETRLSEIQQRLAIYRSNLNTMDVDIAYSTIDVNILEVMEYTRDVEKELTFVERVVEAIKSSCDSFAGVVEDVVIFAIYAAPYLIISVVILVVVLLVEKKKPMARRKKTKNETMTVNETSPSNDEKQ